MPNVDTSHGPRLPPFGPVGQQAQAQPQRRYRGQFVSAAAVAAFAVCLPFLATRNDPPREWGGVVLLGNTLLSALLVLITGGLLVALGRIRPLAGAFGTGALLGVLLGGVLWAALLVVVPGAQPARSQLTPPPPSRPASALQTGHG